MVYYPSLPLIMKSENKQQQLLCSPLGTDGQSFQTAMSLHPSVVGAQQQHQQQLQHQTISNNVMLTNQTSSSSSSLLPLSSSTLSTSSASLSAAPSATTLLISQNQSFLHNIKIELPQGPQSHHQIQLSQQQPQMHVQQQLAQQPHQHQQNGGSNSGSISSSRGAESSNQKAIYKCEQCNMTFGSKSAHTSHMKSHVKNENNFQMSAVASSRNASGQSATNQGTPTAGGSDPYQCNVCKKTFAVPARLIRHYRTHTGERPFECEFCHKMFSVKENLQVHRRIHTKERPYKCDVCGRAFEHSGKLHRHMRIHTGERPHKCSVCNKTFIQSGQLVIHMRTHTGEKPYKCPVEGCGKGFTCSKQLKVHSRTHTGEKPYHCDICFRDFGYNHVLKLHRVQHYGSKCYKCTICDETFKNKKEMEAHIKGHANEMPDDDDEAQQQQTGQSSPKPKQDQITNSRQVSTKSPIRQKSQQQPRYLRRESLPDSERSHDSSAASSTTGSIAMETPVDTSSETNSENEETVVNGTSLYDSSSMYQRLEQTTGIPFNLNTSRPTINPALLAAATIASRRVDAETNSAVNMSTMSPIGGDSEGSRISSQLVEEMDTNTSSEVLDYYQNSLGIVTTGGNPSLLSAARSSPMQIYEPMTMMKQNGYFAPAPVAEFRSSLHANDIVRRVEAAIAGAEPPLTPPPSSSTESPRSRSSSPESDSIIMADRDVMTLPLRKRKLYLNDNQTPDVPPVMRMNSVIQFAKAS